MSDSDERFTPRKYILSVKKLFGGEIDLDPFSSEIANRRIGAPPMLMDFMKSFPDME